MIFDLLLRHPGTLERDQVVGNIRRFDPAFSRAAIVSGTGVPDAPFILTISEQRIALSVHTEAHPQSAELAASLSSAHYEQALKTAARNHHGFIRAEWITDSPVVLDAMVTLAGVLGALYSPDALVVIHAAAHASLPAQALAPEPIDGRRLPILRAFPLGLLFVGFSKYEIEGREGIWMATNNAALLGLQEFAMHAPDHSWGQTVLDIFDRLHRHALKSGAVFNAGDTVSLGTDLTLRFIAPTIPLEFMTTGHLWLIVSVI
jgi:hypothetical protein